MRKNYFVMVLMSLLCIATTKNREGFSITPDKASTLEVTYLANEGFMIAGGGKKVLIDALFREGVGGYAVISPATRALLEQARSPFDGVDVALATHFHADHFDAEAVLAHLKKKPADAFLFHESGGGQIAGDRTIRRCQNTGSGEVAKRGRTFPQ